MTRRFEQRVELPLDGLLPRPSVLRVALCDTDPLDNASRVIGEAEVRHLLHTSYILRY